MICKVCGNQTANKCYCCKDCQILDISRKTAVRINRKCLFCGSDFFIKEWDLKAGRGKYCSRKCNDCHKKITYLGTNNPMYGKCISDIQKELISNSLKKKWQDTEFREKVLNAHYKSSHVIFSSSGYWPGTSPDSMEKKKNTFIRNYGVPHNWSCVEVRETCEKTCMERYGKSSLDMARESSFKPFTKIEKITQDILEKNNIQYERNYKICYEINKYKLYDFFIVDKNILIEIDGDYWHANPDIFSFLNDVQKNNIKNDLFKNELASKNSLHLLRFWETEVYSCDYENNLLEKIFSYVKKN